LYQQISWEYLECSGERGDVTHPAPPPFSNSMQTNNQMLYLLTTELFILIR
jgi:hypothetical protein